MPYQASHRFARMSAQKIRSLATLIRSKYADDALETLRFLPHRGARMLEKVLKSAMANAENQRADDLRNLVVVDARVDGGPIIKRIQPRARGMAFQIKKRMSHIKIVVESRANLLKRLAEENVA